MDRKYHCIKEASKKLSVSDCYREIVNYELSFTEHFPCIVTGIEGDPWGFLMLPKGGVE